MSMYTKDKSTRITLRLTEEQFAYVKLNADVLGVSPSEFLRMVVNVSMASMRATEQAINRKDGQGRENDEADKHHLV